MNIHLKLSIALILIFLAFNTKAKDFLITDFGAVADGLTLNTKAVQKAIDKANTERGGKVIVPNGIFLTGTINLKSNVELYIEEGAVLLGSTDIRNYYSDWWRKGLIVADNQENIAITGKGTINGLGQQLGLAIDSLHHSGVLIDEHYNEMMKRPGGRAHIIQISRCKKVKVSGVNIINSSYWTTSFRECNGVEIDSIRLSSDVYYNNDGIDILDCKNVRITNSYVNSSDDGICLKSEKPDLCCENIIISNNRVRSSASAIKFGTSSTGGFKNITIENIVVYDTYRSALALEIVDGGTMENITATNITAINSGCGIFIKLGQRNTSREAGTLKNVTIKDVFVQVSLDPDKEYNVKGPKLWFFHNTIPASITGIPGHYVQNVKLENIEITYPGKACKGHAYMPLWRLDDVPEEEHAYPEFSMFGELPSWGFYIRHVDGLTMKNVRLSLRDYDFRPAYVFDDVKNLSIRGGTVNSGTDIPQVVVKDISNSEITNFMVEEKPLKSVVSYGTTRNTEGLLIEKQD
jgi:polygalacturonase